MYFSAVQPMCKEMAPCRSTVSSVLEMKARLLFVLTMVGKMKAVQSVRTLVWFVLDQKVIISRIYC